MRLRLLAFLPLAVLLTFGFLASASSLVSALERSLLGDLEPPPMRIVRYETECDVLLREIHTLSHEVATCEPDPDCAASPLLCASGMSDEITQEYERLRAALNERCGLSLHLMDQAWGGPAWGTTDGSAAFGTGPACGVSHDGLEARANGHAEAERFFF